MVTVLFVEFCHCVAFWCNMFTFRWDSIAVTMGTVTFIKVTLFMTIPMYNAFVLCCSEVCICQPCLSQVEVVVVKKLNLLSRLFHLS